MRIALVVLTFSIAMFGRASVPAASAFDVTGHWVGKWSCKGFSAPFTDDNGKLVNKFTFSNKHSTLDITQNDQTFAAIIDAAPVCQGGANAGTFCTDDSECPGSSCPQSFPTFYNVVAVPAVKDPANNGNVILLDCDNSNTLPTGSEVELIQASIKTKVPDVKASFKGTSIFADDFPESAVCKYSYQRVGETDLVGATSCP